MASPFSGNSKKLEQQLNAGLSAILLDKQGDMLKTNMDKVLDKIYNTASSKRHKAKGSEPVGSFSQYGVPVDSGRLQGSIKKIAVVKSNGHFIGRVIQDSALAPYGKYIEYGHGLKGGGWVAPQSFMRSALYKHKGDIKKLLKK